VSRLPRWQPQLGVAPAGEGILSGMSMKRREVCGAASALVEELLQLTPEKRSTAQTATQHPFLAQVRARQLEQDSLTGLAGTVSSSPISVAHTLQSETVSPASFSAGAADATQPSPARPAGELPAGAAGSPSAPTDAVSPSTSRDSVFGPSQPGGAGAQALVAPTAQLLCQCSGHCYNSRHRHNKARMGHACDIPALPGASYCDSCICEVPLCLHPRLRGPLCYKHKGVLDKLPRELVLVRERRNLLQDMLPADFAAYLELAPFLRNSHTLHWVCGAAKEPTALRVLGRTLGTLPMPLTPENVHKWLANAAMEMDQQTCAVEHQNLSRQGARPSASSLGQQARMFRPGPSWPSPAYVLHAPALPTCACAS
jgi:hypothetical protein